MSPRRLLLVAGTVAVALGGAVDWSHALSPDDNAGFIYGVVTTRSGTEYKGFLRWGTEEGFWDDLFHSLKQDMPHLEELERADRRSRRGRKRGRGTSIEIFGRKIRIGAGGVQSSRIFISRFGDIAEIRVDGDGDAEIVMRGGAVHRVSGYSNDVSGKIHVVDDMRGEIDLKWKRIENIKFMAAPRDAQAPAQRLFGKVESEVGEFEGFIQWDKQECMSTDLLDGDTEDGKLSIKMGNIRSIERRSRRSSEVELKDGTRLTLRGSNDVNSENRGIMIEDPRYGRVTVKWDEFDKVTFETPSTSGRGYDDYRKSGPLKGTVIDIDGASHRGRIIFDLDEAESWEMLNGSQNNVVFDIPFENVAAIEPLDYDASMVHLRSGEKLELEDSQDVTDRNDGVLVMTDSDNDPRYLPWDEIREIRFDE